MFLVQWATKSACDPETTHRLMSMIVVDFVCGKNYFLSVGNSSSVSIVTKVNHILVPRYYILNQHFNGLKLTWTLSHVVCPFIVNPFLTKSLLFECKCSVAKVAEKYSLQLTVSVYVYGVSKSVQLRTYLPAIVGLQRWTSFTNKPSAVLVSRMVYW